MAMAAVLSADLSTLLESFQLPDQPLALQQHKRILNRLAIITALVMMSLRVIMMLMLSIV
jgi:hypothetical protein